MLVKLPGTDFEGAQIYRASLQGVQFTEAKVRYASLFNASAVSTDFSDSDLRKTRMSRMRMRDASLVGADLSDAELWQTDPGNS